MSVLQYLNATQLSKNLVKYFIEYNSYKSVLKRRSYIDIFIYESGLC